MLCLQDGYSSSATDHHVSSRLENPEVNPITGPGRTAAMVNAEVQQAQQRIRKESLAEPDDEMSVKPAIFQGDYLLIRLAIGAAPLSLQRVMNGIFMSDAKLPDATFTTIEYSHTPLPGVPGLWGTFSPRVNASYDRHNKHSGSHFVRHLSIGRDVVKLYNVQTFVKKATSELRIKPSSLEELASLCPEEFAFPDQIPNTHTAVHDQQRRRSWSHPAEASSSAAASSQHSATAAAEQEAPAQPRREQPQRSRARSTSYQNEDDDPAADSSDEEPDDVSNNTNDATPELDSSDEAEVPPPVPTGMKIVDWDKSTSSIATFAYWASVDQQAACWHTGKVQRVLRPGRRDRFTHDAKLDGSNLVR
eukprot:6175967-Pleurochrysis_carterae.AAC.1